MRAGGITKAAPVAWTRAAWYLTAVALGLAVFMWISSLVFYGTGIVGVDVAIMTELGRRWTAAGTMYLPYQLAGPYSIAVTPDLTQTPALYPPAAGPLFAPLQYVPPVILWPLWWALPLGYLAWSVWDWRPAPWAWPVMALCLAGPTVPGIVIAGGTSMWAAALVAAGLRKGWPAAFILLKPTLLPFALVGVRSRWWWVIAGTIAVLTLLGPWRDFLTVTRNAADSGGIGYSLGSVPLLLIPVIAWRARR